MLEDGQVARATLNVVGSVLLCLGACWCGLRLARGMG
jgi:fluoride ion exporter CrcB/FEX